MKVLLFDVDDTVVKGQFFTQKYEADFGVKINTKFFKSDDWQEAVRGKISDKEAAERHFDEWKIAETLGSTEALMAYWYQTEDNAQPDMLKLVDELRRQGHLCFVATTQASGRTKFIWEEMHFKDHFDGMLSSSIIGYTKSEPEFYDACLIAAEESDPANLLLIDDSKGYTEAAKAAGLDTISYSSTEQLVVELRRRDIKAAS